MSIRTAQTQARIQQAMSLAGRTAIKLLAYFLSIIVTLVVLGSALFLFLYYMLLGIFQSQNLSLKVAKITIFLSSCYMFTTTWV